MAPCRVFLPHHTSHLSHITRHRYYIRLGFRFIHEMILKLPIFSRPTKRSSVWQWLPTHHTSHTRHHTSHIRHHTSHITCPTSHTRLRLLSVHEIALQLPIARQQPVDQESLGVSTASQQGPPDTLPGGCTVGWGMCSVYWALYTVLCALCTLHSALCTVYWALCNM